MTLRHLIASNRGIHRCVWSRSIINVKLPNNLQPGSAKGESLALSVEVGGGAPEDEKHGDSPEQSPRGCRSHAPYPLFIYMEDEPVVCVGAGKCAERKVRTLLEYGANVTVVSPDATEGIQQLASQGTITWLAREYREGDAEGALFVVCATDDAALNNQVFREAHDRSQLVNVVDDPPNCNAIVPSILRRGMFQVAVSSAGAAPTVARDFRRKLEEEVPDWFGEYIDVLSEVRCLIKSRVEGPASVREPLYAEVCSSGLDARIAAGERPAAEEVYEQVISPLLSQEVVR